MNDFSIEQQSHDIALAFLKRDKKVYSDIDSFFEAYKKAHDYVFDALTQGK